MKRLILLVFILFSTIIFSEDFARDNKGFPLMQSTLFFDDMKSTFNDKAIMHDRMHVSSSQNSYIYCDLEPRNLLYHQVNHVYDKNRNTFHMVFFTADYCQLTKQNLPSMRSRAVTLVMVLNDDEWNKEWIPDLAYAGKNPHLKLRLQLEGNIIYGNTVNNLKYIAIPTYIDRMSRY